MRYILCILLSGCAAKYAFTPSANEALAAKPHDCTVEATTGQPTKDYQEVGTLETYSSNAPKDLEGFRRAVSGQVCEVGGDAAIGITDHTGRFTSGKVIRYVGVMAEPLKHVDTPTQQAMDEENPNL